MRWFLAALLVAAALAGCVNDPDDGTTLTGTPDLPVVPTGGPDGAPLAASGSAPAPVDDPGDCQDAETIPVNLHPVATIETNMGTIVADLFAEYAPRTVANFVCLAQSGYYDGISFHRIITDFMMQGGDPNTLDNNPSNDGQGGPGYDIPDEFHAELRHDKPGLLSMANAGRGTGGSQFFITFVPTPHLNDRHTIFGAVRADSMAVVETVNSDASSGTGTPAQDVIMDTVTIDFEETGHTPAGNVTISSPWPSLQVDEDGGRTQFIVVVGNREYHRVNVQVTATGGADVEDAFESFSLPARQKATVLIGTYGQGATYTITADGGLDTASVDLEVTTAELGPKTVKSGDQVTANYIGMTPDGRFFDTSLASVAAAAEANGEWFETFGYRGSASSYSTFSFQPGGGVIEGFTDLAVGTIEGGSAAGRMPPEKAYGNGGCQPGRPCLAGMTLIFHLEVVDVA